MKTVIKFDSAKRSIIPDNIQSANFAKKAEVNTNTIKYIDV